MLQQSWDETREWVSLHTRATVWGTTALVLVLLAVTIAASRDDGSPESSTTVRADQSAMSLITPTTYFGNDILANPNRPADRKNAQPGAQTPTGMTLRSGNGLHLYTGTIPDYRGGNTSATTTPGSTEPTAPSGGGTGGGPTPTAYPASVFGNNRIAYVTSNGQTWTVNPDGTDARFVANSAYFPAWAPQHAALAVVDGQSPGGILSYITPSGGRYALTPAPDAAGDGDSRPTWSPDGVRLAFGRIDFGNSSGYSSIWVINRDGQHAQRISIAGCFTSDPSWSPNGTHIAFWSSRDHCSSGDPIGATELYVMNSNGSNVKRLGSGYNAQSPAFSPDGSQIAYATDNGTGSFDIYVMNADGSEPQALFTQSGDDTDPTWSPDGTRIAFTRKGSVYSIKADGTDLKLIIQGGTQPSWS